jgi:hypothetical protein
MKDSTKSIVQKVYQKIIQDDYTIRTIMELCNSIGISKKSFYKVYSSKDSFILDLLSFLNSETSNELEKNFESENELVVKVIQTFHLLFNISYKKNKITDCYGKQNQETEFLTEVFILIFTNYITKILEKIDDKGCLNPETNYYLFSEVLVKFTINALRNNDIENNETNSNLIVDHLLINALKGICAISEHSKIDKFLTKIPNEKPSTQQFQ